MAGSVENLSVPKLQCSCVEY
uniref:Uncharacterized protein n=1 Tax=Anguilla anguilla TaxID=7936 RepID=A0A0E9SIM7_ANGAN